MIKYEYYDKDGTKTYEYSGEENGEKLARELIAKKINKCQWIKRISRSQCYVYEKIYIYYDHGGHSEYYIYE